MKQYDELIKKTIRANNTDIYSNLLEFLTPVKMGVSAGAAPATA